jgi:hypothetical protein
MPGANERSPENLLTGDPAPTAQPEQVHGIQSPSGVVSQKSGECLDLLKALVHPDFESGRASREAGNLGFVRVSKGKSISRGGVHGS